MTSKLDKARELLASRIEEIDQERSHLVSALDRLKDLGDGGNAAVTVADAPAPAERSTRPSRSVRKKPGKGRKTSRTRHSSGKHRAPRGQREAQLIESIKAHPGLRVSEYANQVGVKPQQLYPILDRLMERDMVEKQDRTYSLKKTRA